MSEVFHSAGEPGATRCSEAATGSTRTAPRALRSAHLKRRPLGLSFFTVTETARGRHVSRCAFDVPDQAYGEGWRTGVRAGCEFIRYSRAHPSGASTYPLADIISSLAEALAQPNTAAGASRRGAACGFVFVLQAFAGASTTSPLDPDQFEAQWFANDDARQAEFGFLESLSLRTSGVAS